MADGNKNFEWTITSKAEGDGVRKTAKELEELSAATEKAKGSTEETTQATKKATEAQRESIDALKAARAEQEEMGAEQEGALDKFNRIGGQLGRVAFLYNEIKDAIGPVIAKVKELSDAWAQGQGFADAGDFLAHAFGTATTEVDGTTQALLRAKAEARALANESQAVAESMAELKREAAEAADNMERGERALTAQLAVRDALAQKELAVLLAEIEAGGGSPTEKAEARLAAQKASMEAAAAAREEDRAAREKLAQEEIAAAEKIVEKAKEAKQAEKERIEASKELQAIQKEFEALSAERAALDKQAGDGGELSERIRRNQASDRERIAAEIEERNRRIAEVRERVPDARTNLTDKDAVAVMKPLNNAVKEALEALAAATREAGGILAEIAVARDADKAGTALDARLLDVTGGTAVESARRAEENRKQAEEEARRRAEEAAAERARREEERARAAAAKDAERNAPRADPLESALGAAASAGSDLAGGLRGSGAGAMAEAMQAKLAEVLEQRDAAMVDQFIAALGQLNLDVSGRRQSSEIKRLSDALEKLQTQIANQRSAGGN